MSNVSVDSGLKVALELLARAALQELVVARGVGPWLDEMEHMLIVELRQSRLPGVPLAEESEGIRAGERAIEFLFAAARTGGVSLFE